MSSGLLRTPEDPCFHLPCCFLPVYTHLSTPPNQRSDTLYPIPTEFRTSYFVAYMLSHFSPVLLFVTLWTVASQAPLSLTQANLLPPPYLHMSSCLPSCKNQTRAPLLFQSGLLSLPIVVFIFLAALGLHCGMGASKFQLVGVSCCGAQALERAGSLVAVYWLL